MKWLVATIILVGTQVFANDLSPIPFLEYNRVTGEMEVPYYIKTNTRSRLSLINPAVVDIEAIVKRLSAKLEKRLTEQVSGLTNPEVICRNIEDVQKYQIALWTTGDYASCVEVAQTCAAQKNPQDNGLMRVLARGAQCAEAQYDFITARNLYEASTDFNFSSQTDFFGVVLSYSAFALTTQYAQDVKRIISKVVVWQKSEDLIQAFLEYSLFGKSELATQAEVEALHPQLLLYGSPYLTSLTHANWVHFLERQRYLDDEALIYLDQYVDEIEDGLSWLPDGYSAAYRQVGSYRLADTLYKAFIPFSHKDSWLPVEQNPYNYYEIYHSMCSGKLTENDGFLGFKFYQNEFTVGNISLADTVKTIENMNTSSPDKADILTFLGSLYEQTGDDKKAKEYLYQAHQACPYYNRAHWGLYSIHRRNRNRAFSDYQDGFNRIDKALQTVTFPADLENYVINWQSLTGEQQKRMKYALRFWAPHITRLNSLKKHVYAKYDFQLLSETPNLYFIKDVRINSGTYSRDNRLWDDVRGLGGNTVIADIGEISEAAWGAYNLVGHEVAHQFHFSLPKEAADCISQLYTNAKARNDFADPYAASNEGEYFAQGVGYFMIPLSSPKRYGLNEQWLIDHDGDLYKFLQSITKTSDVSQILCPVVIEPDVP